jgi:hypothetical protein
MTFDGRDGHKKVVARKVFKNDDKIKNESIF